MKIRVRKGRKEDRDQEFRISELFFSMAVFLFAGYLLVKIW